MKASSGVTGGSVSVVSRSRGRGKARVGVEGIMAGKRVGEKRGISDRAGEHPDRVERG